MDTFCCHIFADNEWSCDLMNIVGALKEVSEMGTKSPLLLQNINWKGIYNLISTS